MIGTKFNRLLVVADSGRRNGNMTIYKCLCDCGNFAYVDKYKLRNGHSKSCGCFKSENLSVIKSTHGWSKTSEYKTWVEIRQRCYNKNIGAYKDYGGRGITVCDRWLESFPNFISDMKAKPSPKHSIDRIDVNLGYSPENCRWATWEMQQQNKRNTRRFLFNGEVMCLTSIAKILNIPQTTMQRLVIAKGMTIEQAVATRR